MNATATTDFPPSPRDAAFWNRMAKRYAAKPVPDEHTYQRKLEITREYLTPESRVVEFGCGTGSTAIAHAPYVRDVIATDFSPRMIEIAQRKVEDASVGNVEFRCGAIETLKLEPASADVVLALSLVHLLEDLDDGLASVHSVLRPGGVLILSTPCIGDHMRWFAPIAALGRMLRVLPVLKIFTAEHLRDALARSGFVIEHDWQPGRGKAVFMVARKPA